MIEVYNDYKLEYFLLVVRVILGILFLLSEKKISKKIKYNSLIIYSGAIYGCVISGIVFGTLWGIAIGILLGVFLGIIIAIYHKSDFIINFTFFQIYLYIIVALIFKILGIHFDQMLNQKDMYDDYTTMCVAVGVSTLFSIVFLIVSLCNKRLQDIVDKYKYFGVGNFFVLGALLGLSLYVTYGPGDWNEMSVVLLNILNDESCMCLLVIESLIVFGVKSLKL